MKAKIGVKKKFNINNEKKSICMTPIRLTLLFCEIYKDDMKLKINIIIKNWSVKIEDWKTSKFKILKISIVSVLFNNKGTKITDVGSTDKDQSSLSDALLNDLVELGLKGKNAEEKQAITQIIAELEVQLPQQNSSIFFVTMFRP